MQGVVEQAAGEALTAPPGADEQVVDVRHVRVELLEHRDRGDLPIDLDRPDGPDVPERPLRVPPVDPRERLAERGNGSIAIAPGEVEDRTIDPPARRGDARHPPRRFGRRESFGVAPGLAPLAVRVDRGVIRSGPSDGP